MLPRPGYASTRHCRHDRRSTLVFSFTFQLIQQADNAPGQLLHLPQATLGLLTLALVILGHGLFDQPMQFGMGAIDRLHRR